MMEGEKRAAEELARKAEEDKRVAEEALLREREVKNTKCEFGLPALTNSRVVIKIPRYTHFQKTLLAVFLPTGTGLKQKRWY